MSWWTEFRDGLETAAGIVLNYYYPGSGILGHWVNSKGSQEQMYGTTWGQAAMTAGGLLGGYNGNFANYTGGTDAAAGGTLGGAGGVGGDSSSGWQSGGYGGASGGASELDPNAVKMAQDLMAKGMPAEEAYIQAGIAPGDMAGGTGSAGAAPSFNGQQGMSGTGGFNASGSPAGGNSLGGGASAASSVAKSTGAMPWGSPGNVASMGSGMGGLAMAGMLNNAAGQASRQADPFGPYRSQYADLMAGITADPSKVTQLPGYQAGMQAVQRSMAAQGYTGSGNMMAAMQKYGGDFYNNAMQMYGGLSGAQFNPASAAQLGLQGKGAAVDIAGRSLGSLGYGAMMAGNQWPRYGS